MKRILVLSVSAGAGHNRAAEALAASADGIVHAEWFDALHYTNRWFRKFYAESYVVTAGRTPALWGLLYGALGRNVDRPLTDRLVRAFDRASYRRFVKRVERFAPDAVVCTHFLPCNVLLAHRAPFPVHVVVTDFDVHRFWVHPGAASYFTATEEVRWQLHRYGFPIERIRATGIPTHPIFARPRPRAETARALGLDPSRRTILFMSGGLGMTDVASALERLLERRLDAQWIVIAGKNERLRRRCEAVARGDRDVRVLGFVTNIQDHMEASDLAITKSGGLTTSECLVRGLPMLVFAPIPGQEERNCDVLLEAGAGAKSRSLDVLDYKVEELLREPGRLERMRAAARRMARPDAAREILESVVASMPAGYDDGR